MKIPQTDPDPNRLSRFAQHAFRRRILVGMGTAVVVGSLFLFNGGDDVSKGVDPKEPEAVVRTRWEITRQDRALYLVPVGFLVYVFTIGTLGGLVNRLPGIPHNAVWMTVAGLIVLGVVGSIVLFSAPQGHVEVVDGRLRVKPFMRKVMEVDLGAADTEFLRWERSPQAGPTITMGPMVRLADPARSVLIGTLDPDLAAGLLPPEGALRKPPSYVMEPEDFRELLRHLGISPTAPR